MKKRILFINYIILDPLNINFRYKYELFSNRYDVHMFHLSYKQEIHRKNKFTFYSTKLTKNKLKSQILYVYFCLSQAWRLRPVHYVIAYDPNICGFIALIIKKISGSKAIIEINSDQLFKYHSGRLGWKQKLMRYMKLSLIRLNFYSSDGLKFVSRNLYDQYAEYINLSQYSSKINVLCNYYNTHDMIKSNTHDNYILLVGYPYDIKGVDVLIKAFNKISSEYPDIKLKIVGHCEDRTPYERLADGNKNIIFRKGVPFHQVIPELEKCIFFVLPSRTEGLPRVIVEAMASGKAVIGSRVGGIPEVVKENETGLLFESENHEELAEKMLILLDNPVLRQQMGEAGYQRAKEHFSPERYTELYHKFIERIDGKSVSDSEA